MGSPGLRYPLAMLEMLAMRGLSLLSALLACAVAWAALAGSADWRQTLAKGLFALLLGALSLVAWRRPNSRKARARQRILRLVAILLDDERRREWAESTPSTDPDEALRADLGAALGAPAELLAATFDADELERLAGLRTELGRPDSWTHGIPAPLRAAGQAVQDAALARAAQRT